MNNKIELTNICKSFGGKPILENVNLTLSPGEITCMMGPSGIGKTTLVNILAGLVEPDSGEITGLEGLQVSAVFQEDRLLEWDTALANVNFVGMGNANSELLLTQAGLGGDLHKKAALLSGGMKRRVCICRALAAKYGLLLLDEPFKGLDEDTKTVMVSMIKEHLRPEACVLCVTHDMAEVNLLGGKLVELWATATPTADCQNPAALLP